MKLDVTSKGTLNGFCKRGVQIDAKPCKNGLSTLCLCRLLPQKSRRGQARVLVRLYINSFLTPILSTRAFRARSPHKTVDNHCRLIVHLCLCITTEKEKKDKQCRACA